MTPRFIHPLKKYPYTYLQGICFSENQLVYGTNNGYVSCLSKMPQ